MEKGFKPHLKEVEIYKPGKSAEEIKNEFALDRVVKLASNENPFGPPPLAVKAIMESASNVNIYPDGACRELRGALSQKLGVPESWFVFSNGSNELIEMMCRAYLRAGEKVIIPHPTFVVYYTSSQIEKAERHLVPLKENFQFDVDAILEAVDESTRIIFISNPNNPTGSYLNDGAIRKILSRMPDHGILFLDEAYFEFADAEDFPSGVEFVKEDSRVIVSRTFSKAYGLAGLRIGYGIMKPEIAEGFERVRQPFNVNFIAQKAALAALKDVQHLKRTVENNRVEKMRVSQELEKLGFIVYPSQANFLLVNVRTSGKEVFEKLLEKGVIVRYFGGVLENCIRVTIGKPEENDIFLNSIKQVLEEMGN